MSVNLIGLSGYIGSGKDEVGRIIQYLTTDKREISYSGSYNSYVMDIGMGGGIGSIWKIKKFSAKLKQIASLLTGIPAERFEDQEYKNQYLKKEWNYPTTFTVYGDKPRGESEWREMSVREFLQRLGTDAIRNGLHTETLVNALFTDYVPEQSSYYEWVGPDIKREENTKLPYWIVTDTRFVNEAQAIKDRGGIVVRVDREIPKLVEWEKEAEKRGILFVKKHPSETSLDNWEFDYRIDNSGTKEELVERVREMLIHFKILKNEEENTESNSG